MNLDRLWGDGSGFEALVFVRESGVEASLIQPVFECSLHLKLLKSTLRGIKMHPKLSLPLGAYSQAGKVWISTTEQGEVQGNPQIRATGI